MGFYGYVWGGVRLWGFTVMRFYGYEVLRLCVGVYGCGGLRLWGFTVVGVYGCGGYGYEGLRLWGLRLWESWDI